MRWCCWLVVGFCAAPLVGCGGGPAKQAITGTVTLDGQPLAEGDITFEPKGKDKEKDLRPEGARISNGSYSVPVMPGTYRVRIIAMKKVPLGPGEPSVSGEKDKLVPIIPPQYNENTTLEADVSASKTKFDFDLVTKK